MSYCGANPETADPKRPTAPESFFTHKVTRHWLVVIRGESVQLGTSRDRRSWRSAQERCEGSAHCHSPQEWEQAAATSRQSAFLRQCAHSFPAHEKWNTDADATQTTRHTRQEHSRVVCSPQHAIRHPHIYTYIHTHTYTRTHIHTYPHTHIHTHIHTHTHTYTHTYIHM